MVKRKRKVDQDKIILVVGMILVAAVAFAGGMLVEQEKGESKKPLVLSEKKPERSSLSLNIEVKEGTEILGQTDPKAIVKQGEREVLEVDKEGKFQFDLQKGSRITIFTQENLIQFDFGSFLPTASVGEKVEEDKIPTEQKADFPSVKSSPKIQKEEAPQEVPKEGQYVGSKNSDKYHLPSCRWAKRIKSENQVWFSSKEEAESKGYQPCGTCMK